MNFFEHQDRARRNSLLLVSLFILALLGILVAMNLLTWVLLEPSDLAVYVAVSIVTILIIAGSSGFRTLQLRGGGGQVAQALGGTQVDADTIDPLRRRLHNVVEEMALASGIPVPEVWVLEHESSINAFAAGYSPADAAVAVTRGALENLSRDELQGVIAHEFSHVFNGDMRLNIRLIGYVYGILVLSIIGRKLITSMRNTRNSRNSGGVIIVGLGILLIGSVGLFFGRLIKAAISRQREYLADASAVQFTRNPEGIAMALKKIAAMGDLSHLQADSEEVGHMLFATGSLQQMFRTHPPLEQRILAVDPSYKPEQLKAVRAQLERHAQARKAEAELAQRERARAAAAPDFDVAGQVTGAGDLADKLGNLAGSIGKPGVEQAMMAALLTAAIPDELERAAHSDQWAQELILSLLISPLNEERESQLLLIARRTGSESEARVRQLHGLLRGQPRRIHLPLVRMAFPQLRRRPPAEQIAFMRLLDEVERDNGRIELREFALTRLVGVLIIDGLQPSMARPSGRKRLESRLVEAVELLALLARHGHPEDEAEALAAYETGLAAMEIEDPVPMPPAGSGVAALDGLVRRLNDLRPEGRERLINGLLSCAAHDEQLIDDELDFLRIICALLRVPLPMMAEG